MINQVLQSLFKKPATVNYPFVKVEMPDKFRGKLQFYPEKCICCKLCMRDCPSDAIVIKKVGEKKFEAEINLAKCVYCAQCVDSCPKGALESTKNFELANLKSENLKVVFSADPLEATPTKT
jgi:formate hydrogenlyase subunit 6/NADH:ubiquinone oxidoreductase subunit I